MKIKYIIIGLLLLSCTVFSRGIAGEKAPSFEVDSWVQTSKSDLGINDFKGKVLYLYGFQAWCPGCHAHGFPTLVKLSKHYKNDKDVAFVAIQTTFEGFSTNDKRAAKKIIKQYNLTMPVAHSGTDGTRSKFMNNYKTGGTPWTIIVDKKGVVRFNDFQITDKDAIDVIEQLKKEK